MPNGAELEAVLCADAWLRRIARKLVGDLDAAEDLVQDAWVASLSKGRRDRPWLFGALRNLRREHARRGARDQSLRARLEERESAPAADEVVSELTLRKRVTDGLLQLREPYRTALYLRFVQDESLPAIARQTGVAVSTAHERVRRGLELLRKELDSSYGGARDVWVVGLLPLAKPPSLAATVIGSVVMGTSSKVALAVLAVVGGVAWISVRGAGNESVAPALAAPAGADANDEAPERVITGAEVDEGRRELPAEPEPEPAASAMDTPTLLAGRLLEMGGGALSRARVGYAGADDESATTSDITGAFELPVREVDDGAPRFECLEPSHVTLVSGVESGGQWNVVVGRSARFSGVVVDADEQPIEGARLTFAMRQALFRDLGIPRPFSGADTRPSAVTDAQGWFEFEQLAGGPQVALLAKANGYAPREVELSPSGDNAMVVVMEVGSNESVITGLVLDSKGAGVPEAYVSAGTDIVTTDARGAFRLAWRLGGAGGHVKASDGVWRAAGDTSVLRAAKEGYEPVAARIPELDLSEDVVLQLGDAPRSITGRVVDEHGDARAGIIVWDTNTTHFGSFVSDSGGGKAKIRTSIEELSRGGRKNRAVLTDADGFFELGGLLERDYELRAFHPASAARGGPWTIAAGADEVELMLESEPETQRVAGRVVTASGAPIAEVWIRPLRSNIANDGSEPPWVDGVVLGVRTDEEGQFEFPALATAGTILELQHELFFIRHYRLAKATDLEQLEIVQAVLCELQVELADADFADQLVVLDDEGEPLELLESFGAFLGAGDSASLEDGKSNVLQVSELGRTLVLKKAGEEVSRRELSLDPAERCELRL